MALARAHDRPDALLLRRRRPRAACAATSPRCSTASPRSSTSRTCGASRRASTCSGRDRIGARRPRRARARAPAPRSPGVACAVPSSATSTPSTPSAASSAAPAAAPGHQRGLGQHLGPPRVAADHRHRRQPRPARRPGGGIEQVVAGLTAGASSVVDASCSWPPHRSRGAPRRTARPRCPPGSRPSTTRRTDRRRRRGRHRRGRRTRPVAPASISAATTRSAA